MITATLNNQAGPTTSKRSASTTVVVKDRQTMVIGGLIRDNVTSSTSKVPFLGDIPILGWLFKSTTTSIDKANLMIFITPYIINNEDDAGDLVKQKNEEMDRWREEYRMEKKSSTMKPQPILNPQDRAGRMEPSMKSGNTGTSWEDESYPNTRCTGCGCSGERSDNNRISPAGCGCSGERSDNNRISPHRLQVQWRAFRQQPYIPHRLQVQWRAFRQQPYLPHRLRVQWRALRQHPYCPRRQLKSRSARGGRPVRRLLGEILVESGLSAERLKKTLDLQKKRGGRIGTLLVRLNFVTEAEVLTALGEQLGLPFQTDLGEIDRELALKLPITYAKKAIAIPLRRENGNVLIATSEPLALSTSDDLRLLFNADISLCLSPSEMILDTVNRLYSEDMNRAEETVQEMEEEDLTFLAAELDEPTDLLEATDDAPIIRLVNSLLSQAIRERASDIHIEPFEKELVARFRIDGILYNILTIQKRFQASIASRVKIMADLNIAERRLPQDGGMRIKIGGKDVDIRVSIVPTSFGERIVLRLLYRESAHAAARSDRVLRRYAQAIQ